MEQKEVKLKMLEPHKAEGIKELCYEAINNPDTNFSFLGIPNVTFGQRREGLLSLRKQANKAMADLEAEADKLLHSEPVINPVTKQPVDNKAIIMARLHSIMDVVQIIDRYSIKNTKEILSKSLDSFAHSVGHGSVNFPLTFEGDEVVVSCQYYEDISLNEKLLAEYTELDNEEKELEFIKKHVELGNISLTSKEDVKKLESFNPAIPGAQPPVVEPVFANLDEVYQITDETEVDK